MSPNRSCPQCGGAMYVEATEPRSTDYSAEEPHHYWTCPDCGYDEDTPKRT